MTLSQTAATAQGGRGGARRCEEDGDKAVADEAGRDSTGNPLHSLERPITEPGPTLRHDRLCLCRTPALQDPSHGTQHPDTSLAQLCHPSAPSWHGMGTQRRSAAQSAHISAHTVLSPVASTSEPPLAFPSARTSATQSQQSVEGKHERANQLSKFTKSTAWILHPVSQM